MHIAITAMCVRYQIPGRLERQVLRFYRYDTDGPGIEPYGRTPECALAAFKTMENSLGIKQNRELGEKYGRRDTPAHVEYECVIHLCELKLDEAKQLGS